MACRLLARLADRVNTGRAGGSRLRCADSRMAIERRRGDGGAIPQSGYEKANVSGVEERGRKKKTRIFDQLVIDAGMYCDVIEHA